MVLARYVWQVGLLDNNKQCDNSVGQIKIYLCDNGAGQVTKLQHDVIMVLFPDKTSPIYLPCEKLYLI
jgi:hypothetical protein